MIKKSLNLLIFVCYELSNQTVHKKKFMKLKNKQLKHWIKVLSLLVELLILTQNDSNLLFYLI